MTCDYDCSGADNDVLQSFKQSLQVLKQVVQREKEVNVKLNILFIISVQLKPVNMDTYIIGCKPL